MESFHPEELRKELKFKAVRSGGKGGQHVNKVSTSVELFFNVNNSKILNDKQKQIILQKCRNRISKSGDMIIVSQTERSQLANKKKAIVRFNQAIHKALLKKKTRISTGVSQAQKVKRKDEKIRKSEKKKMRKKDWLP